MLETAIISALAGTLFCMYFGTGVVARLLADRRAASLRGSGRLALTYDDGPSPLQTDRILNILAQRGATATFFVIGRSAEMYPEVLNRIAGAGHEIAWHSQKHLNQWHSLPIASWFDTAQIPDVTHATTDPLATYRPPFGKLNLVSLIAARIRGLGISTWTIASGDTFPELPLVQAVVDRVEAEGGGVILMHDHQRTGPDSEERERFVRELTIALLDLARDREWKIAPVPESRRSIA
ncbi:MAG: polysaccharide deacetylase family protein [Planctomycetota bacterium]|nr:polysaccharide deacetylase family protein [Planctomycetota bacterium]